MTKNFYLEPANFNWFFSIWILISSQSPDSQGLVHQYLPWDSTVGFVKRIYGRFLRVLLQFFIFLQIHPPDELLALLAGKRWFLFSLLKIFKHLPDSPFSQNLGVSWTTYLNFYFILLWLVTDQRECCRYIGKQHYKTVVDILANSTMSLFWNDLSMDNYFRYWKKSQNYH